MPHAIIRRRKNERASERKIKKKKIRRGDSIIGARTKGLVRALIEARSYIYCNYVRVRGIAWWYLRRADFSSVHAPLVALFVHKLLHNTTLPSCIRWLLLELLGFSLSLFLRARSCIMNNDLHFRRVLFLASRCHFCAQGVAS